MNSLLSLMSFDEYVSGEFLSERLGVTRAAIWKRMELLRKDGIPIDGSSRKGYRLVENPLSIMPLYWQSKLQTKEIGQSAVFQEEMTSTNTVLKKLAMEGAVHGTVALCEHQTKGRGRLERKWEAPSPDKQLVLSVLLRPKVEVEKASLFTLVAGLSLSQAIESVGVKAQIKWPNDLVVDGKKLCGILLEMSADMDGINYIVIGTGINIASGSYPDEIAHKATSINEQIETSVTRQQVLVAYLNQLEKNLNTLEAMGFHELKKGYEGRLITLNQEVKVLGTETFIAHAMGIDDTGALLVQTKQGKIRRIVYGDVSIRGVKGYV